MKTSYLPIIVGAIALSLASANAMPDLGRETGKFIRKDDPAPKDVRTFEPANSKNTNGQFGFIPPLRPRNSDFLLGFIPPLHPTKNQAAIA